MTTEPNTDVKAAIELLSSTLDEEKKRIYDAGAEAMARMDASTVQAVLDFAGKLEKFQQEVAGLLTRWEELQAANDVAAPSVQKVIVEGGVFKAPPPAVTTRSPARESHAKKIRVTFEDGSKIFDPKAANTFIKTIEKIGVERARKVGLVLDGGPLIDTMPNPKHPNHCHPIAGGYYVNTYTGSEAKKKQLDAISKRLGLNLKVEVLDPRKGEI